MPGAERHAPAGPATRLPIIYWSDDLLARRRKRPPPTAERALETYDALLDATRKLLGEAGFEALTTNRICAVAGVTPPAFYHYFTDKYDVLEEIAYRLIKRQNSTLLEWLHSTDRVRTETAVDWLKVWFRKLTRIAAEEPGASWTMRAIRALPSLAELRLASARTLTDMLAEFFRPEWTDIDEETMWHRLRIMVELSYMVDELAMEDGQIEPELLFHEVARLAARF